MLATREADVRTFDVICAGEALWKFHAGRMRPGGGAVTAALALSKEGVRVGLSTVMSDDDVGRQAKERIAARGVDVAGVALARPRRGFVLVDASGGAEQVPSVADEEPPFEVPASWFAQVVLLSGLSPVVSHAAALCRTARAGRRGGSLVVIDFNASLHAWAGRDPRTIHSVLREVDAARCSIADLAVLGMDVATVRTHLRTSAVLVVSDGLGSALATGPFGEVAVVAPELKTLPPLGAGDAFTAGMCAELARRGAPGESPGARWHRALRRGQSAQGPQRTTASFG